MKARYLALFSYIGTHFRSSEKIWLKTGSNYNDINSVQGTIEAALLKLRSVNYPKLYLSSRTDGGVHALCATAHFDLDRFGTKIYTPNYVSYKLNKFFNKTDTSILVKKCILVPDNFDARRKALSRTYLYRFAIVRDSVKIPEKACIASYIPIEEWKRCFYTRLENFDVERLKEGAKYLVGYHDFTTFKKYNKLKESKDYKHNRRELLSVVVRPGSPLVTRHTQDHDDITFDYWEIEFKGRAFVHNQIRRMLGALLGVAVGKLPPEEIKVMLQVPSRHSWHTHLQCCPAHGLYLCNIEYDPADFDYQSNQKENTDCDIDGESES